MVCELCRAPPLRRLEFYHEGRQAKLPASLDGLLSKRRRGFSQSDSFLVDRVMNCARLRLNADTTTIFVRDGWLIIEAGDSGALQEQLRSAAGSRLLTVAEVSQRTGFTAGAVRDWIKRSLLAAVRVGKEYRIREGELEKLIEGKATAAVSVSKRIGRRRKPVLS